MQRKVFVAVPTITGKVTPQTRAALMCADIEAAGLGWTSQHLFWSRDSIIVRARNILLAKFLETDCTDLLWVDSDVAWGPGVFTRLMHHDVHFVAGAYRAKTEGERYMVRTLPHAVHDGDLIEVETVPFGCCRISRACVQAMWDAYKDIPFIAHEDGTKCALVFDIEVNDGVFWGEDFLFCRRWRALGGRVWVDPELPLHHVDDDGRLYSGTYGQFLRRQQPVLKVASCA